jgi:alpha-tubulin suppressor-like RCC1 family protein
MAKNGGIISGGFQPLKAPNAPTIDSTTSGYQSVEVSFSAPSNTGDGTISSYTVTSLDSTDGTQSVQSVSASPASFTYSDGNEKTFAIQAFSEYGPGAWSGYGNAATPLEGLNLYAVGQNGYGQLGTGIRTNATSETRVLSGDNAVALRNLASGPNPTSALITTDNKLFTFGRATSGALGDNQALANRSSPTQVGSLTNWEQVSMGQRHCLAVKTDGTLWGWGQNNYGQLGTNNKFEYSSPVQIGTDTDWKNVVCGFAHTFGIKTDNSTYAWGADGFGSMAQNSAMQSRSSPVQITGKLFATIQSDDYAQNAVATDGTLWSWGSDNYGVGGRNTSGIPASSPVQIGALTSWSTDFAKNAMNSQGEIADAFAVLNTDDEVYVFGRGINGMLGQNNIQDYSSPVQIAGSYKAAGFSYYILNLIKTDGTWYQAGSASSGAHAFSQTVNQSSPVQIGSDTNYVSVASTGDEGQIVFKES